MSKYKINHKGQEFEASEYQEKIFDFIEHGIGNGVINASAGSAKTTTIINGINFVKKDLKVLFISFNKRIVQVIKEQVNRDYTHISTFHSLGYSILKENNIATEGEGSINEMKYVTYINENIKILCKNYDSLSKRKQHDYLDNLKKLVNYSRYYDAFSEKEIKRVSEIYVITPVSNEFEACKKVLIWGKENIKTIDHTDMIWLVSSLNLITKRYLFDFIFIDEVQDTTIIQAKLIEKCFKRGARFIAVGDKRQQINVWCGSSEKALDAFSEKQNVSTFDLPISYRCPKKVIELAKEYSPNIQAAPNAIEGEVNYDVNLFDAKSHTGDLVLCRNIAPLIYAYFQFIRYNKPAYIRGFEELKNSYFDTVNNTHASKIDPNLYSYDGMFPILYNDLFNKMDELKEKYKYDDDEVLSNNEIIFLYDRIESLKIMSEGLVTTEELKNRINDVFTVPNEKCIQLSTIHRAKGDEADNVFIYCPSLVPSPFAKKEWEIKTENNLNYVAITRAKKTLNYIKEENKYLKNRGYFNPQSMKELFQQIKNTIQYNRDIAVSEESLSAVTNYMPISKLGDKPNLNKTTKKKIGALKLEFLINKK